MIEYSGNSTLSETDAIVSQFIFCTNALRDRRACGALSYAPAVREDNPATDL